MFSTKSSLLSTAIFLFACLFLLPTIISGQTKPDPSGDAQDVIKFDTSLVQTDVMVFDKNGKFVEGLKPDQFHLKIDKTPREISFFELIRSGTFSSKREEVKSDRSPSQSSHLKLMHSADP